MCSRNTTHSYVEDVLYKAHDPQVLALDNWVNGELSIEMENEKQGASELGVGHKPAVDMLGLRDEHQIQGIWLNSSRALQRGLGQFH